MANEFAERGQPRDHPPRGRGGPGRGRGSRDSPTPAGSRPRSSPRPTGAEVVNIAPDRAHGRGLLRARRPRADPPAHGGDADRALGRPRPDERRHRAVPRVAGVGLGGRRGQDPGLRRPVRGRSRLLSLALLDRRARRADARDARSLLAASSALLIAASLGLGLLISIVSRLRAPGRPAVAAGAARLGVLLGLRAADQRVQRRRSGSRRTRIPVTNGIDLIQDVMLRGEIASRGRPCCWRRSRSCCCSRAGCSSGGACRRA